MEFAGLTWVIKEGLTGPGPNHFSKDNVWLADDGLHLRVKNGTCAEVYSVKTLGYGTYIWYLDGRFDRFKNIVLGLFTYEDDDHEIDIELTGDILYTIQGRETFRHRARLNGSYTTHQFRWVDTVEFVSRHGHDKPLIYAVPNDSMCIAVSREPNAPRSRNERVHMNLWLQPDASESAEVVIKDFRFIKWVGTR